MNEAETRAELIDPARKAAGWGMTRLSEAARPLNACQIHQIDTEPGTTSHNETKKGKYA
jgi:hypothetical protein